MRVSDIGPFTPAGEVSGRRDSIAVGNMRPRTLLALLSLLSALAWSFGCDPSQTHNGCKIYRGECTCGYGCKSEYVYRTRRGCLNTLQERSSNICYRAPCLRGICIQTQQGPGFACKCEGTGFYGQRCEKACPTFPMQGLIFPHECVII